jgi:hypothetical protein
MNGKVTKRLRNIARTSGAAEQTTYVKAFYNKSYVDILTGVLKGYRVYTLSLDVCQKSVYKELKKNFKRGV